MTPLNELPEQKGPKYYINIEGTEYPWDQETITVSEIRQLGSIPADQHIIEEDENGTEITLDDNATIEIKPGHRHGRAPKYRRG